jgi:hypothetical protein
MGQITFALLPAYRWRGILLFYLQNDIFMRALKEPFDEPC